MCTPAIFKGELRGLPDCPHLMVATQQKVAGALSGFVEQPWLHPFPSPQSKLLKGRLSSLDDCHSTMWGFWLLLFCGEYEVEWGKGGEWPRCGLKTDCREKGQPWRGPAHRLMSQVYCI